MDSIWKRGLIKRIKKMRLLISLLVAAYILTVREGMIQEKTQKMRRIKNKNGDGSPAVSIFRNGLQSINNQIVNYLNLDKYLPLIEQKKISTVQIE